MTRPNTFLLLAVALLAPAVAGCVGFDPSAKATPQDVAAQSEGMAATEVCFTFTNPYDGAPVDVRGTRFHVGAFDAGRPTLLMTHGASSDRHIWTGGWGGKQLAEGGTLVQTVAEAGYNVITYDRPGYGDSPWVGTNAFTGRPRDGTSDTTLVQLETIHHVVAAIRDGEYEVLAGGTCGTGTVVGTAAGKVIFGGHSYGALLAKTYIQLYGDVDGAAPVHWGGPTLTPLFYAHLADCSSRDPGTDYMQMFCTRTYCEWLTSPDLDATMVDAVCGDNGATVPDPAGIGDAAALLPTEYTRIGLVPQIPVLLVYGGRDFGWYQGDIGVDTSAQDDDVWAAGCACTVTEFRQPGVGHLAMLGPHRAELSGAILDWLQENFPRG